MLSPDEEDDYDKANYYSEKDPAMCAPEILRQVGRELHAESPLIRGWKSIAGELSEYNQLELERVAKSAEPGCEILNSWVREKGRAAKLGVLLAALYRIQRLDIVDIFNKGMKNKCHLSVVLKDTNEMEHIQEHILASGRRPLWRLLRFWLHAVASKNSCRLYFRFHENLSHKKWNNVSQNFKGMEIRICQVEEDKDLTWNRLTTDSPVTYLDHSKRTLAIENSVLVRAEQDPNDLANDRSQLTLSDIVWNLEESV